MTSMMLPVPNIYRFLRSFRASFSVLFKRGGRRLLCFGLLLLILFQAAQSHGIYEAQKVVVIHSYHKGLSWTDSLVRGIDDAFEQASLYVEISHDFMDTKRIFSEEYLDNLVELYAKKYSSMDIDVIITTDDHAFQFVLKNHDRLFPDIPVVFCGVNHFKPEMLDDTPWFTGVVERFDIRSTLQLVKKIHPEMSRFYAISDQSLTGKTNIELFQRAVQELNLGVEVVLLDNHSMMEVREQVAKLTNRDITFWLTFTSDRLGSYYSFRQSAALISEVNKAPLYSFWDFHLGYGVVGGRLASGFFQGRRAAELAFSILYGEDVRRIPVITESPNRYMFDYVQLKRFDIHPDTLPEASVIINLPESFYERYKVLVWSVCLSIFALVFMISLLCAYILNRRKTNLAIMKGKDRFQHIFNNAAVALLELDCSTAYQVFEKTYKTNKVTSHKDLITGNEIDTSTLLSKVRLIDCNQAAVSLYRGQNKQELLEAGLDGLRLIASDTLLKLLHALHGGSEKVEWEERGTTLCGEELHLLKNMQQFGSPLYKENHSRMIISVVDITEREQYVSDLKISEDRFRTLFDKAASGIALCDSDGNYLRVNGAFSNMIGYSKEELQSKNWRDITHSDSLNKTESLVADIYDGKEVHPTEKKYLHKSGKIVWALLTIGLDREEVGRTQFYIAQAQDITQIKEVQARMRLRDKRYKQLFEADLSGFYIATPSGILLLCNKVFVNVLGFKSVAELVGQNISRFYQRATTWSNLVEEIKTAQRVENLEVELLRSDGESRNIILNAIGRFDENGQLLEIQGYIMDISEQKELEDKLIRAQKMEAIGLMAGGVAHDLNNILSGIVSYPDLMIRNLESDSQLIKPLSKMRDSGQRAAAVVADLLTVARGAANVRELHSLDDLVIEYLNSPECGNLRFLYPNITLHLDQTGTEGTIFCSPVHIKKCIMNLVTNGIEAIEGSGNVQVRVGEQTLLEEIDGEEVSCDYVTLEVEDNGTGISEQDRERIFEPFYTKKVMGRSGTGLGLAVVWNAVQDHGGQITVKSSSEGTIFTLFFPRYEKIEPKSAAPLDPIAIEGHGESILVVDDEPMLRDIAREILEKLGYKVVAVESGEAALKFLRDNQVDLVLLDMFMEPGINGCQAYERIIRMYPDQKAVIASGYSKSDDVKKALRLGVGAFIEKPYSLEQLGCVIAKELIGDADVQH